MLLATPMDGYSRAWMALAVKSGHGGLARRGQGSHRAAGGPALPFGTGKAARPQAGRARGRAPREAGRRPPEGHRAAHRSTSGAPWGSEATKKPRRSDPSRPGATPARPASGGRAAPWPLASLEVVLRDPVDEARRAPGSPSASASERAPDDGRLPGRVHDLLGDDRLSFAAVKPCSRAALGTCFLPHVLLRKGEKVRSHRRRGRPPCSAA